MYTIQIPANACPSQGPGIICTIAGDGVEGFTGDGGPATSADVAEPTGVALDSSDNVYIADTTNNRIREVMPRGIISTVAGNGLQGYSGDMGPATRAELNLSCGVTVDSAGSLYIADSYNIRIRKVTPAGIITTIAGDGGNGYSGDGGVTTNAELSDSIDIAIDCSGNVYIATMGNNNIRKITAAGIISMFAGNRSFGFGGDDGPATAAAFQYPSGIALDGVGDIYLADTYNNRVRKIIH